MVHASMFKWALPTAVPNPKPKPKAKPKAKAMPEGPICSRIMKKGRSCFGLTIVMSKFEALHEAANRLIVQHMLLLRPQGNS